MLKVEPNMISKINWNSYFHTFPKIPKKGRKFQVKDKIPKSESTGYCRTSKDGLDASTCLRNGGNIFSSFLDNRWKRKNLCACDLWESIWFALRLQILYGTPEVTYNRVTDVHKRPTSIFVCCVEVTQDKIPILHNSFGCTDTWWQTGR